MPLPIFILLYTQLVLQFFMLTPYWTYKKMMQLFNPVDWNHPETQNRQVFMNGDAMNGDVRTSKLEYGKTRLE